VPLYEFECGRCGARFEELVDVGTSSTACRVCGADDTHRVYSPPGAPFQLVKTNAETRKQERRNAQLRAQAKQRFKSDRQRARERGARKP
jgi:putative FmdB family regulatory protein